MKSFKHFFWFCSGATLALLKRCPTESSRFVSMGGAVFFTGILAALSAGFAIYSVFDNYWPATLFGLLWGLMIFNLDRFLVSSLKKNTSARKEWVLATPRLILAILIAMVVAKPLEVRVFMPEISAELSVIKEEQKALESQMVASHIGPIIQKFESDLSVLQIQISEKEKYRNELIKMAQEEADGTGGSGKKNLGPIYTVKKANADKAEQELNDLRSVNQLLISRLREKKDSVLQVQSKELAAIDVSSIDGLALQIEALDRLTNKYDAISYANIFIMLLFIAIETSPVLIKLMSQRGPYDELLEAHEHSFINFRKSRIHKLDKELEQQFA